jgi:hypothetical protein
MGTLLGEGYGGSVDTAFMIGAFVAGGTAYVATALEGEE